jgi:hypothetical protein
MIAISITVYFIGFSYVMSIGRMIASRTEKDLEGSGCCSFRHWTSPYFGGQRRLETLVTISDLRLGRFSKYERGLPTDTSQRLVKKEEA